MGHRRVVGVLLAGILLVAACSDSDSDVSAPPAGDVAAADTPDCSPSRDSELGTNRLTMDHDGETREYDLSVPPGYNGKTAAPLVVDLHGFMASIEIESALSNLPADAGARSYVVATPEALPTVLPIGDGEALIFWNVTPVTDGGEAEAEGGLDAADDIGFVEAMVTSIENDLCIDTDRIHLTGMSNGAGMTMALACSNPDRYASVAPVAAVNLTTSCPSTGPIATVAFHGDADPLVGYEGGSVFGFELGNPSVPERMRQLAELGSCAVEPRRSELTAYIVLEVWGECDAGVDVELYTVLGGAHDWWGSDASGRHDLDATEIMLDFFDAHPRS